MNRDEVRAAALKLDMKERASLARELLLSLENPSEEESERLWAEVADNRLREMREGRVSGLPGDEVLRRARAIVA
jgi:hypothetical protein